MSPGVDVLSRSPDETTALAASLGASLRCGDWVALCGALGAGKTTFAKGVARGLQVPPQEPVVSPTFVLIREYSGRERLFHADLYRLSAAEEVEALGFDELRTRGVLLVEWADGFPGLIPPQAIVIELEHVSESERRIRIAMPDLARLEGLKHAVALLA